MYSIGDLIVYGGTGVCRVTDVRAPDFSGARNGALYYILKPLHQECVIYAPVDNTKIIMRPIISAREAERLVDTIPLIRAEAYHSRVTGELAQHYDTYMKTYDCADLIRLTMSIYAKKRIAHEQKRKIGSIDEAYMKRAQELLFGELAAALGICMDDIPAYIAQRVGETDGIRNM